MSSVNTVIMLQDVCQAEHWIKTPWCTLILYFSYHGLWWTFFPIFKCIFYFLQLFKLGAFTFQFFFLFPLLFSSGKVSFKPRTMRHFSLVDCSIETKAICSLVLDTASMNTTSAPIINSFLNCWLMLSLEFTNLLIPLDNDIPPQPYHPYFCTCALSFWNPTNDALYHVETLLDLCHYSSLWSLFCFLFLAPAEAFKASSIISMAN